MTSVTFRPDIQGLRAIAVLLVVAYHLWPEGLTGGFVGVDVFFVISGFLITAHLLHHPPEGWRDLLEFWGRRIRRILPAAFLVLAVTAVASRIVAPETRWAANAGEIIASALYVQNWVLASNSVDYLAAGDAPTPVQHYWSLSIEEQFYLLWPILILGAFWLVRRVRLAPIPVVRLAMLSVVCASLAVSLLATQAEPASAYFITPTRVWELALGGCIATLPALGSSPRVDRARDGIAWVGIAMVLVAGATFTAATPFPAWPRCSRSTAQPSSSSRRQQAGPPHPAAPTAPDPAHRRHVVLDLPLALALIALWPFAVGAITPIGAVAIVGATVGLATITKVCVEDPFRFAPSLRPLVPTFRFAVVGMLVVSMLGSAQLVEAQMRLDAAVASTMEVASGPSDDWGDELQAEFDDELANGWTASPLPTSTADHDRVDGRTGCNNPGRIDVGEPSSAPDLVPRRRRDRPRLLAVPAGPRLADGARSPRRQVRLVRRLPRRLLDLPAVHGPHDLPLRPGQGQDRPRRQLPCRAVVADARGPREAKRLEHHHVPRLTLQRDRCGTRALRRDRRLPRLRAVGPGGDPRQGVRPRHHLGAPVRPDVG